MGSVLPGTALIPGLAFKKTEDNRELYFVVEHPKWAKIVQLAPNAQGTAQNLAIQLNQAAASIAYDRQKVEEAMRKEAERSSFPVHPNPQRRPLRPLRPATLRSSDSWVRCGTRVS